MDARYEPPFAGLPDRQQAAGNEKDWETRPDPA